MERDGVNLTNLDQPLFEGAEATKGDLVDYLDAVHPQLIAALADRPLSVIRALRDQPPFMQKNLPRYAPDWIRTARYWAGSSRREVSYAVCDDRRTLLWFANQRAVEYHPSLGRAASPEVVTHLVLDLDPPEGSGFDAVVATARLVRRALDDPGLEAAVKTSGAKGVHVFVPLAEGMDPHDAAAATRALAARAEAVDPDVATTAFMKEDRGGRVFVDATRVGGATVVAAYSPRARPGLPVSFPVDWDDLDSVSPADFNVRTAPDLLAGGDPWAERMPGPQVVGADLIEEGRAIPGGRLQAMQTGRRRAREGRRDLSGA